MDRPVVVCGLGRVGWRVVEFLRKTGATVAVLDLHPPAPGDPRLDGLHVVTGDCRDLKLLEKVGVPNARGVLIVTSDDLVNVSTALLIRKLNPDCRVVVRMFNQNLISRLGGAVKNITALSVSALTAPLLALSALTGDSLGVFALDTGPQQVAEIAIANDSEFLNRTLNDLAGQYQLLVVGVQGAAGELALWPQARGERRLAAGDRLFVCARPDDLEPLFARSRGGAFSGVRWAGRLRRAGRTAGRALGAVDLSVKLAGGTLLGTLALSTAVFHFALGLGWADGLFQTVRVVATAADLGGGHAAAAPWEKLFLSLLKLAGTAIIAAFTAILTQYLLRAKLGGAFEARRIPDGGHVVVCGLGNVGFRCVEELVRLGQQVVAVERDGETAFAATVRRMGVAVIQGDATVPAVLKQARCDEARAVVAATASELANLEIALLARDGNPAQRVVVRLTDPQFAEAVRDAANVRQALAIPTLAAPAFAAALYGDRVQTLIQVGERTLAVVELRVAAGDAGLEGVTLFAAMIDYGFLPVAVAGRPPFGSAGIAKSHRLAAGDRLTVILDLADFERVLRRDAAARHWSVVVESVPPLAVGELGAIVRTSRGCTQEEAVELLRSPPFTLGTGLSRGAAEELLSRVARERATGRVAAS